MSFIYRNSRTGQVSELPERSPRLDALEMWHLIGTTGPGEADEQGGDGDNDAVTPSPGLLEEVAEVGAPYDEAADDLSEQAPVILAEPHPGYSRPAVDEPKTAWVAYAVERGMSKTDARALSKAALIQEFGGPDGED